MKRTCPVCDTPQSLTVRSGLAGLFLLCSAGCDRDRILAALTHPLPEDS